MIYNDKLPQSYGTFVGLGKSPAFSGYTPIPSTEDYNKGYLERYFVKKINESIIMEISHLVTPNENLYKKINVQWKISGPKNNVYKNGIIDKAGVMEQNRFEIDRIIKEEGVDLSSTLTNLLEYWRGR